MARPHKLLRDEMHRQEVTIALLARELNIGTSTASLKMNAHNAWTSDEMWAVMEFLSLPPNQLHMYFPRNGQNEPVVKRRTFRRAV
jgi:hypothetical protein